MHENICRVGNSKYHFDEFGPKLGRKVDFPLDVAHVFGTLPSWYGFSILVFDPFGGCGTLFGVFKLDFEYEPLSTPIVSSLHKDKLMYVKYSRKLHDAPVITMAVRIMEPCA